MLPGLVQDPGSAADSALRLDAAIEAACTRIPPLWTLRNFVAVNPYLALSGTPFHEAVRDVERLFHARSFPPTEFYRERARRGRIRDEDLGQARRDAEGLCRQTGADAPVERVHTPAEDAGFGAVVVDEIARFCAGRFDAGQAAWPQPWRELPLYRAWREAASIDRSPEIRGIAGFRRYVRTLPEAPRAAIAAVLAQLGVEVAHAEPLLARALASMPGWAGHARYLAREAEMRGRRDDVLVELLAVRMAYEGGVAAALARGPRREARPAAAPRPASAPARADEPSPLVWQLAFEAGFRRELLSRLVGRETPDPSPLGRPALQAVFCIDVRSEVLRRHLEALSPTIRTLGFAGFFGFPIEYVRAGDETGAARCPVLLNPAQRIREDAPGSPEVHARLERSRARHRTFKALRLSSVSAFPFVETLGPLFGLRLLGDAGGLTRPHEDGRLFPATSDPRLGPSLEPTTEAGGRAGMVLEDRVALAEGALRNMGLVEGFAEVVLLCGHGSETTNNPYASGLDCGACGGHRGDVNARIAAAVLEDPAVRAGLAARGIHVPEDTRFVAGIHETTTDTVRLLDADRLPPEAHERLQGWLEEAGRRAARERERRLRREPAPDASRAARRRSRDWAEVRPEWGLAGNAAFVAAPRARTRGLDLEGRVFLHDYDAARDASGSVLELILTAPLVVASWINLQYYASTVDNDVFGSGNKVLHNVVSRHGVMLGNRSDLRPGLPWQSVHDGVDYVHEPLRLLAVVEADLLRVEAVLEAHPDVKDLVRNGWIQLVVLEPGGTRCWRFGADGCEPEEPSPAA
jgi:uncharacterized protein YbcC (UPF0753/DUF2309 family)